VALAATAAARHAHLRGLDDEVEETDVDGDVDGESEDGADMLTLQTWVCAPWPLCRAGSGDALCSGHVWMMGGRRKRAVLAP
jgi:hypothetical protein